MLPTRARTRWRRALRPSGCGCRTWSHTTPDPILFPYADQTLSVALKHETELFFESLVRDDRSLLELLTADYTFVNERIARHYGIPNVTGAEFRRVTVPEYRRGILGHGSVLTLTSIADRTSPVMRGKWVMEVLLGSPPPPPPPNVPALEETKGTNASGPRALGARAHGAAPEQPGLQRVPPGDRSARPGARELRRHGQVAGEGRPDCGGRGGHALRRQQHRRPGGAARRRAAAQGRVPAELHAEPDDLRPRPARRARPTCRRCAGSSARPRPQDYRISAFVSTASSRAPRSSVSECRPRTRARQPWRRWPPGR